MATKRKSTQVPTRTPIRVLPPGPPDRDQPWRSWVDPAGARPAMPCTSRGSCPACDLAAPRREYQVSAYVGWEPVGVATVSGRIWDHYAELALGWPSPLKNKLTVRKVDGVEFLDPVFS